MKSIHLKLSAIALLLIGVMSSCKEQIEEGARFTFLGKTVATYLADEEQQGQFSSFIEILSRGECLGLMKAYGQYTCFAPTNEAVERFLFEQDSIWRHSQGTDNPIETGIHSTVLSELSKEKCIEIARNHILPKMYLDVDFIGNQIPDANMNDRNLTLAFDTLGGKPVAMINSEARIQGGEEVENGVVHVIDKVLNPSTLSFISQIGEYDYFSKFFQALDSTGYANKKNIGEREDRNYTEGDKIVKSIRPTEDANYPANRYFGYTAFLVPDAVLEAKHNIRTFADLVDKCREWYPDGSQAWEYDEENDEWKSIEIDHTVTDYTDPRHPLNQFVGYHLLDRKVAFENLVCYDIRSSGNGGSFDSEGDFPKGEDRTEYYVTMNNRILKATMPRSDKEYDLGTILLNYAKGTKGEEKMNVEVYAPNDFKKMEPKYEGFVQEALNGSLNVIDDVLLYDEVVMSGKVLYCIMRFDVSALLSELTNSNIRWKYGSMLNSDGAVFIPHTYCKNVDVRTDDTRLFYLAPHTAWHNYQGDEMMALGFFDFAYRLPPVPTGTYEIRMGYSASQWRHMVQVYLDDEVTGLPIDLRIDGSDPKIGWKEFDNYATASDEDKVANEKEMKNRGYMRGPTSFYDNADNLAWESPTCLRAVIATKYLSADKPHWLRFKNVLDTDDGNSQFMHDYFEIVPTSYLRDENITVEERRK